ncbi:MAG TPA: hypothetical protein VLM91_20485 [Candidatus Methylomirabilis sp.]|nr:hypothetical protein [Candidatus Methylomirabilis sp.]
MRNAKHRSVKFTAREMDEDLPAELDFGSLKFIGRGPKAIETASRRKVVPLDPDVARVFDNAEAVNDALRGLIQLAKQSARKRKKIA